MASRRNIEARKAIEEAWKREFCGPRSSKSYRLGAQEAAGYANQDSYIKGDSQRLRRVGRCETQSHYIRGSPFYSVCISCLKELRLITIALRRF